jgi:biopolymer transport protein TolQ
MDLHSFPIFAMIERSGWIARIIVMLLMMFSIASWAIIINRWGFLSTIAKLNRLFRRQFEGQKNMAELERIDKKLDRSPLAHLGKIGLAEMKRILNDARLHTGVKDWSFYLQSQFGMASEHLGSVATSLAAKLDRGLIFLAIISSVAPFIGLLGTVWGIMNSFFEIGNQGSASLPVVAPGIAEALIVTAAGLAVAIPAVFFYNLFTRSVQRIEEDIDEFGDQLLLRLKREIFNLLYSEKQSRKSGISDL